MKASQLINSRYILEVLVTESLTSKYLERCALQFDNVPIWCCHSNMLRYYQS